MAQSTRDRVYTSTEDYLCSAKLGGIRQSIFLATLNILISVTAILGNVLIIAALPKVSFLHSSSKLNSLPLSRLHRSLRGLDFTAS